MTRADHRGTPAGLLETWRARAEIGAGPAGFPQMIEALRTLQDRMTAAAPPEELISEAMHRLNELSEMLEPHAVGELRQITGHLVGLPGRGQTMTPVIHVDESDDQHANGTVTYGRFYLGGNGAVHGGAVPLVFDEILGRLANTGGRSPSRTAYLHVDFRSITPIETELRFEGWFEKEEGRKRLLRATMHHGEVLCAEAEGLFVALRPGQP
ncbi:PaaI family thioesterase [Pseudonocardia kunmingensis]|uniref:Thioesterase superfamily protein n=1 Tax=Pseudonocardia kunmingensis TaxID=630975 RepID=A0A543DPH4_9PSEU|nr:PaaI family thioesterase [Pseudonocardia kunmingensis]TQM11185.1 hypothetical protein FB558_3738 [Pseudonocardia kunmingensis]